MGYEIDFLAVERGDKAGTLSPSASATCTAAPQDQFVGIVDGGYTEDGEKLVEHDAGALQDERCQRCHFVAPDDDHCLGLEPVVEQMDVQMLWMHRPWNHAENIRSMFTNAG